jgi:hypothetical protein
MTNVIPFNIPAAAQTIDTSEESENMPYFDMVHIGGRVVIDANVSAAVGLKIAQLILEDDAAAIEDAPKPAKRPKKSID